MCLLLFALSNMPFYFCVVAYLCIDVSQPRGFVGHVSAISSFALAQPMAFLILLVLQGDPKVLAQAHHQVHPGVTVSRNRVRISKVM